MNGKNKIAYDMKLAQQGHLISSFDNKIDPHDHGMALIYKVKVSSPKIKGGSIKRGRLPCGPCTSQIL